MNVEVERRFRLRRHVTTRACRRGREVLNGGVCRPCQAIGQFTCTCGGL